MRKNSIYKIAFTALMAAIVYVATMIRFPFLGSKIHLGNAACLLSGLLLGGPFGGLAAGIGSVLTDILTGYSIDECIVTFVSKFAMALICAVIAGREGKKGRLAAGSVVGALSYVALYMLKTFIYRRFVYGYPMDAVWATMASKLPASMINAVFAMVVTPFLYTALRAALDRAGLSEKLK